MFHFEINDNYYQRDSQTLLQQEQCDVSEVTQLVARSSNGNQRRFGINHMEMVRHFIPNTIIDYPCNFPQQVVR